MNISEFESYARDLAYKSVYNFTLLGFSSLALSLQFSPQFGTKSLCILYISWFMFLISSMAGGWIVTKMPIFYRINAGKLHVEKHVETLKNPNFDQAVKMGNAFMPDGKQWSVEDLETSLFTENAKIELAANNMKAIEDKLPKIHSIQTWCYIVAIFLNVIFAIINLNSKA